MLWHLLHLVQHLSKDCCRPTQCLKISQKVWQKRQIFTHYASSHCKKRVLSKDDDDEKNKKVCVLLGCFAQKNHISY